MKIYLPELNYYFLKYWNQNKSIFVDFVDVPSLIETKDIYINDKSIFGLIFEDIFLYNTYNYLFQDVNISSLSKNLRERIYSSRDVINCMVSSEEGNNIFNLNQEDLDLLNKLKDYKSGNDVTIEDINYEDLNSEIAILIYQFLDLKLNNNFEYFYYNSPINQSGGFVSLLELYILNEAHRMIRDTTEITGNNVINLIPVRKRYIITGQENSIVEVEEANVYGNIYIYLNVNLLVNNKDYTYSYQNDTISITFTNELNINDVIIIDYFKEIHT